MAQTFNIEVVTPTGIFFQGEVREVIAHGPLGEFGVLADHVNFVTTLVPGLLGLRHTDGRQSYYLVAGGFAEVKDGAMTVLADEAEQPSLEDEEGLKREAQIAEEHLAKVSSYENDYAAARQALDMLRARLAASELVRSMPAN
jgi:F-type H+-transporting ATPase subunit epsilon